MISVKYPPTLPTFRFANRHLTGVRVFICSRFCLALMIGAMAIALSTSWLHAQASGIVIYKENTAQPDGSAKVFEYTMIRRMGEVTQYYTTNGQKVQLTQFQPQTPVAYPDLMSQSITDPTQLGPLEKSVRSYRGLVKTYPRAAAFLNPHILTAEEMIRRVKGGEVWFNGGWIARDGYAAMIQREDESAKDFLDKSREKKRAEEEQARRIDMENRRRKK